MRAYKFLDDEGRAPFTGAEWVPGEWVEAASATICREGVHGFRPEDIARWLSASLWELELDGEIADSAHKLAAARGRLVRRVDGYSDAVRELAEVGAWRCRDRAVQVLRASGDAGLAERFAAAATLEELAALGEGLDDGTFAGRAAALAADAAQLAVHGNPAQSPFVAVCSAGHAAAGPTGDQAAFDDGYAQERAFQSAWLTDRLGLQ